MKKYYNLQVILAKRFFHIIMSLYVNLNSNFTVGTYH